MSVLSEGEWTALRPSEHFLWHHTKSESLFFHILPLRRRLGSWSPRHPQDPMCCSPRDLTALSSELGMDRGVANDLQAIWGTG